MEISVIICCYNSTQRIKTTLMHLAKQKLIGMSCEIIMVDNNCTDDTVELTGAYWKSVDQPFELRILHEQRAGLSYARKKGVDAAKGEFILFCDDDNWLAEDYLQKAVNIMQSNQSIGALCGQNIAVTDGQFPNWFYTYQRNYAAGVINLDSGDVTNNGWIWGAGFITRKKLLNNLWQAGFENYTTDRKGNQLTTGGDVEICKWIILAGYKLWYDETLKLKHCIPQNRLTKEYIKKLMGENKLLVNLFKSYDFLANQPNNSQLTTELIFSLPSVFVRFILGKKTSLRQMFSLNLCLFRLGLQNNSFWHKQLRAQKRLKLNHTL
jgi:glycosyltransferase involved in cell wall biosynthesis